MKDRPRKSGRTPTSCAIWGSSSSLAFAVKQILPVLPAGYVAGFQIRRKMPQNSGVAGGGRSPAKPVSACANPWKQGKNRELRAKTASIGKAIWQLVPRNQSLVRRIPCAVEQGIKCAEQGRNCPASGTSGSSPGIIRPSADVAVLSLLARPAGVGRRAACSPFNRQLFRRRASEEPEALPVEPRMSVPPEQSRLMAAALRASPACMRRLATSCGVS